MKQSPPSQITLVEGNSVNTITQSEFYNLALLQKILAAQTAAHKFANKTKQKLKKHTINIVKLEKILVVNTNNKINGQIAICNIYYKLTNYFKCLYNNAIINGTAQC